MSDLADREGAWHRLLGTSLLARERVAGGLRLTISADAVQELRALVELERNCCPWITFAIDAASVTMTAAGEGEDVLVQMFTSENSAESALGSVLRRRTEPAAACRDQAYCAAGW